MVYVDVPPWVRHGGKAIYSCDFSPDGARLATAGNDAMVRIWTVGPLLNNAQEKNATIPKKLATLTDHNGSVNIVRFSPDGKFLASGGDDEAVILYHCMPGRGDAAFGSGNEGPNHENWKPARTLRRHRLGVTGLAWSPDSSMVVSCSLDSDAIVWNVADGNAIATLQGHENFLKGVAWDPIGTYIATHGEDFCCRIWSTHSWACVAEVRQPLQNSSERSLFYRFAFSALGDQLAIVNTSNNNLELATLSKRERWEDEQANLVGHDGTVVAAAWSPRLIQLTSDGDDEGQAQQYLALGSEDRAISVWALGVPNPRLVIRKAFKRSVVDLCWSPDGRTLVAVSVDGTMFCMSFAEAELGEMLSAAEVDELILQRYGDRDARVTELHENAAVLMATDDQNVHVGNGDTSLMPEPRTPQRDKATARPDQARAAVLEQQIPQNLSARMGPTASNAALTGEKRGAPTTLAASAPEAAKRPRPAPALTAAVEATQPAAAPVAHAPLPTPSAQVAAQHPGVNILAELPTKAELSFTVREPHSPLSPSEGSSERMVVASNAVRAHRGRAVAEISCFSDGSLLWSTCTYSAVSAITGTAGWASLALQDGTLQILSAAGRRIVPPLVLGAPVVLLAAHNPSHLLALLANGDVRVWDVPARKSRATCSARAILSGNNAVPASLTMTASGLPCLTLTSSQTYMYNFDFEEWMCVVDWGSYPSSAFHSSLARANGGELSQRMAAAHARRPRSVLQDALRMTARQRDIDSCAHLEICIAAAEAVGCGQDWSNWLLQYVGLLSKLGDSLRLSELCSELLGPPSWRPNAAAASDVGARNGTATEWRSPDAVGGVAAAAAAWSPTILGHDKRALLRDVVLPAMMRTKALSKLALDFDARLKATASA